MPNAGNINAAVRLIQPEDVTSYLARSVLTKDAVTHATSARGFESILRKGVILQSGGVDALGKGFYTALTPATNYYGSSVLRAAIPTERPFWIPWVGTNSDSLYLWRVARATGTSVKELKSAGGRVERLEAARQALLGAGYDSVGTRTPWPSRNLWVVGIDEDKIRVVADDDVLTGIANLKPFGPTVPTPVSHLANGSVLAGHDALSSVTREIAESPGPVSWQVRQLNDPAVRSALSERATHPEDLFLIDQHKLLRGHELAGRGDRAALASYEARGATVTPYGSAGDWLHGKLIAGSDSAGEPIALLRTNTDEFSARHQANVGVFFRGDSARAAHEVIHATASGDATRLRAAAQAAEGVDLLVHDARNGIDGIRPKFTQLLDGAVARGERFVVVDKELRHPETARRLAEAQRAGAQVQVTVGKIDDESLHLLHDAGVDLRINAGWIHNLQDTIRLGKIRRMGIPVEARPVRGDVMIKLSLKANGVPVTERPFPHLNLFANEQDALVTSFHHMPEMAELHGSQELGAVLHGDAARSMVREALDVVGPTSAPT
ncbi:MAG: hypothetical protein JWL76_2365 [Thermoleophilia bacterium]|nr:hypothetical protein [Thermoleophilia bacterium]